MKDQKQTYWVLAMQMVGDFGATIAVPVVLLALAGKWLDQKYQTKPLFILIGFGSAFLISSVAIYKKAKRYAKEYKDL